MKRKTRISRIKSTGKRVCRTLRQSLNRVGIEALITVKLSIAQSPDNFSAAFE